MLKYFVIAFLVALGWHLGNFVVKLLESIAWEITRRCLPRKYWDTKDPDYLGRKKKNQQENNSGSRVTVKGFYKD